MLLSYTDFLIETYTEVDINASKIKLLEAIAKQKLDESEYLYYTTFVEHVGQKTLLECLEGRKSTDLVLESIDEKLFEESLLKKAQNRLKALQQKVKEKGKEALNDLSDKSKALLKVGGQILKPVKTIIDKLAEVAAKAWDKLKGAGAAAVNKASEKIKGTVSGWMKKGEKKKSLTEEVGNLGAMGKGAGAIAKEWKGFMTKGAAKAAQEDGGGKNENVSAEDMIEEEINSSIKTWGMMMESAACLATVEVLNEGCSTEQLLEEFALIEKHNLLEDSSMLSEGGHGDEGGIKIPFVSAILDKMHHMPPFSLFAKLGKMAEGVANNVLEKVSFYLNKLGGPGPFKFVVIGALIGIVVTYYSESATKSALFSQGGALILGIAVPGAGILYTIMKYGGIAIALHEVVKTAMGAEEKGGDEKHDDKKEGEKKEDKEKEGEKKKKPWWKF